MRNRMRMRSVADERSFLVDENATMKMRKQCEEEKQKEKQNEERCR